MAFFSIKKLIIVSVAAAMLSACSSGADDNMGNAQSAFEQNSYQKARIFLLNELKKDPNNIEANALYARVMLGMADGDSAQAAINKLPDGFDDIRAMKAHALILKGQSSEVLNLYQNIDSADYSKQDWRMIIWAKLEFNELDDAYADIQTALKLHPNNSEILSHTANYHLLKADNPSALNFADKAIEKDSNNFEAYSVAGRASLRMSKIDEAAEYYRRADEAFPDNPLPALNLAGIAMDKNDLNTAKPYVEKALRLNGSLPLTKFIEARFAHASGDYESAKDILQDAKSGLSNFGPAIFLSGKVAFDMGEYEVAAARLRRAVSDNPGNIEARQLLDQIPR